ncbi:MAG: serine protein kinase, partial [Planctomycetes bacterium]|nr:serine protein kinase [Planctomycetota bacterium]
MNEVKSEYLNIIKEHVDASGYKELHWEGSFTDYLEIVQKNPAIIRNAFQRLYDMIISYGYTEQGDPKDNLIRFNFFNDVIGDGRDAIYGLTEALMHLVSNLKSAAYGYGVEKRVLLLHGPVGSSKSTIVRLIKRGLEKYSTTEDGAIYTFGWKLGDNQELQYCPMNEEPLRLVPIEARAKIIQDLNQRSNREYPLNVEGSLCPHCRWYFTDLMNRYDGVWDKILDHIRVKRILLSEKDRVGIGTFQPKDEKNQDSTELTGDINYRKIALFGSDSDPRAFNFDGEFNIANRGLIEFIE